MPCQYDRNNHHSVMIAWNEGKDMTEIRKEIKCVRGDKTAISLMSLEAKSKFFAISNLFIFNLYFFK